MRHHKCNPWSTARPGPAVAAASLVVWLSGAEPAAAQVATLGGQVSGLIEVGGRAYLSRPSDLEWGKFGEYRDLASGFYVPSARLRYLGADDRYALELGAWNGGRENQRLWLRSFRPGVFNVDVQWDQTPHALSTTGRILGDLASPFALPSPRPDTATWNSGSVRLGEIGFRTDAAKLALALTPASGWDMGATYVRTRKDGNRPMGMAFGSPGNNHREILEPIDQTIHDFRVSQGFARGAYRLQLAYNLSAFQNAVDAALADNPLVATDFATTGSSRGRTALAPDNLAHGLSAAGAVKLPLRTTVRANVSYGWRRQNAALLPYTVNSAISTAALGSPPASLEGDVRTVLLNASATTHPIRGTTITAKYRRYELSDRTRELDLPGRVLNDRTLNTTALERHHLPYTKQNAGLDLGWRATNLVSTRLSWGWERWDRSEAREVRVATEHTPRVAVDVSPVDWFQLRGSYTHAWRRGDAYVPVSDAPLPELRRFDMADRDQDRADLLAAVTPWDRLALTATYGVGRNAYEQSEYGLQDDRNWTAGGDVTWSFSDRGSVFAGYQWEEFKIRQRSRYRDPTQPSNLSFDWVGNTRDQIGTVHAGMEVRLPGDLDVGGRWSFSDATEAILAFNPTTPTGGTTAQNTSATAQDYPELTHSFHSLSAYARYRLPARGVITLRYGFERFQQTDFRTDGLKPATGADIFLGNDFLNYRTHFLTVSFGIELGPLSGGSILP